MVCKGQIAAKGLSRFSLESKPSKIRRIFKKKKNMHLSTWVRNAIEMIQLGSMLATEHGRSHVCDLDFLIGTVAKRKQVDLNVFSIYAVVIPTLLSYHGSATAARYYQGHMHR